MICLGYGIGCWPRRPGYCIFNRQRLREAAPKQRFKFLSFRLEQFGSLADTNDSQSFTITENVVNGTIKVAMIDMQKSARQLWKPSVCLLSIRSASEGEEAMYVSGQFSPSTCFSSADPHQTWRGDGAALPTRVVVIPISFFKMDKPIFMTTVCPKRSGKTGLPSHHPIDSKCP